MVNDWSIHLSPQMIENKKTSRHMPI